MSEERKELPVGVHGAARATASAGDRGSLRRHLPLFFLFAVLVAVAVVTVLLPSLEDAPSEEGEGSSPAETPSAEASDSTSAAAP